jgi:hypothetical protein
MCKTHYQKAWKFGDPLLGAPVPYWSPVADEVWKDCVGFEGIYMVSNRGRVWSVPRPNASGGYLSPHPTGGAGNHPGYPTVSFCVNGHRTYHFVHKLMLEAFVGPVPEGMECMHLDDIPTNNFWPENLRYGTHKENQAMMDANNGSDWRNTHKNTSRVGTHANQPKDDGGKFIKRVDVLIEGQVAA